jgi:hypothetical protein
MLCARALIVYLYCFSNFILINFYIAAYLFIYTEICPIIFSPAPSLLTVLNSILLIVSSWNVPADTPIIIMIVTMIVILKSTHITL